MCLRDRGGRDQLLNEPIISLKDVKETHKAYMTLKSMSGSISPSACSGRKEQGGGDCLSAGFTQEVLACPLASSPQLASQEN